MRVESRASRFGCQWQATAPYRHTCSIARQSLTSLSRLHGLGMAFEPQLCEGLEGASEWVSYLSVWGWV